MSRGKALKIISPTPQETERIGSLLGTLLVPGDVIALSGELGSGKTTLVRGLAQGMGFSGEEVASPSFTLVNEYDGPLPLFHIDLYRLGNAQELHEIVRNAIPQESLWITLRYQSAEQREIEMQPQGDRYEKMIEEFKKNVYNTHSV